MGSGASKASVEQTNVTSSGNDGAKAQSSSGCPVMHDERTSSSETATSAAAVSSITSTTEEEKEAASKCPMHNADGSYSYDWRAVFLSPHRPGGSKPLHDDDENDGQLRAKITRRATFQDGTMASPGSGCPVTEYNVYSQPIDPKNNMPRVANQLPAAQQSKNLSTERVNSSIPKVSVSGVCDIDRGITASINLLARILFVDPRSSFSPLNTTGRCRRRDDVDVPITTNVLQFLGPEE